MGEISCDGKERGRALWRTPWTTVKKKKKKKSSFQCPQKWMRHISTLNFLEIVRDDAFVKVTFRYTEQRWTRRRRRRKRNGEKKEEGRRSISKRKEKKRKEKKRKEKGENKKNEQNIASLQCVQFYTILKVIKYNKLQHYSHSSLFWSHLSGSHWSRKISFEELKTLKNKREN